MNTNPKCLHGCLLVDPQYVTFNSPNLFENDQPSLRNKLFEETIINCHPKFQYLWDFNPSQVP